MLSLYFEVEIDVLSSVSLTTQHIPAGYWAGEVSTASEVLDRFTSTPLPDEVWEHVSLPVGGSMLGINLIAARLYNAKSQFVLGGYYEPVTQSIHWVAPVKEHSTRTALHDLAGALRNDAERSTYSGHLVRHSAQMLELSLVDAEADRPAGFAITGDAPLRIAFNHGVSLPEVA